MHLRLTVIDPTGSGHAVDCVIDGPAGSFVRDVRAELLGCVGRHDGQLFCEDRALPEETVLGVVPLLDGAVLTVDRPTVRVPRSLLELHVTAGPDAGAVHPVGPGEHVIGRALEASVRVEDPDVSRLHASVQVAPDSLVVLDLDSTNGTTVDGQRVTRAGAPIACGQVLRVGASRLELVAPRLAPAACRADGEGRLELNRPPRLAPPLPAASVSLPTPPPPRDSPRLPVIALAVPLVAGLGLVAFTGNPTYLLFVLLSPLMVLGTFVSDRVGGRRSARAHKAGYDEALAAARADIDAALAVESAARRLAHPGAATLLQTATEPRARLWERRRRDADFLALRVGLADLPADVEVRVASGDTPAEPPVVTSVPVTLPLAEAGVLGLAGPRDRVLSLTRFLVAQVAGWHSPRHLAVVLLVDDRSRADDWDWARWLPHLRPAAGEDAELLVGLDQRQVQSRITELLGLLDARTEQSTRDPSGGWGGRTVVVVLDGARALRQLPESPGCSPTDPRSGCTSSASTSSWWRCPSSAGRRSRPSARRQQRCASRSRTVRRWRTC